MGLLEDLHRFDDKLPPRPIAPPCISKGEHPYIQLSPASSRSEPKAMSEFQPQVSEAHALSPLPTGSLLDIVPVSVNTEITPKSIGLKETILLGEIDEGLPDDMTVRHFQSLEERPLPLLLPVVDLVPSGIIELQNSSSIFVSNEKSFEVFNLVEESSSNNNSVIDDSSTTYPFNQEPYLWTENPPKMRESTSLPG